MKHSKIKVLAVAVGLTLGGAAWSAPGALQQLSVEHATLGSSASHGIETYLIEFAEAGALHYRGGQPGLMGTADLRDANGKFDVNAAAVAQYRDQLRASREGYISSISQVLARPLDVTHHYSIMRNGIAAELSADEAAQIAALPGVKSIKPAGFQHIDTYRSWEFMEADKVWTGESTPDGSVSVSASSDNELFGRGNLGNGVVIGIIDTGAAAAHPSFANNFSCGHTPQNPKLIALDCSVADSNGYCAGPNPEANAGNGHGVHVAGTAGGNIINNQVVPAPAIGDERYLAGIAPCATIRSYKVCQADTCSGAHIAAGIESAIEDGVDVINFSISGGNNPWADNDRDFLDAVGANIFVAASAGNTRDTAPNPIGAVSHLGPWVATVANSSHDKIIGPHLLVTDPTPVPELIQAISLTPGSTTNAGATVDLVGQTLAADPDNVLGCTDDGGFAPGFFDGMIAIVQRGVCPFTEKIDNAAAAGALAVIIGNNQPGAISMDTTGAANVPAFSISSELISDELLDFVLAHPAGSGGGDTIFASGFELGEEAPQAGATGDYRRALESDRQGYVLSASSLRGPTRGLYTGLTKPDITAPGSAIYAATDAASGDYQFMSGTSMSGPQVAGAAALIRAVHPSWSPAEVKSALMSTSRIAGFSDDGVTPWTPDDVGSGHVNVARAAMAGLIMHESYDNYLAADPRPSNPDPDLTPQELNVPSMRDVDCVATGCSWTRTVTNGMSTAGTWQTSFQPYNGADMAATVAPASFTLQPGETQEITITATPGAGAELKFGHVFLTEAGEQSPQQHLTVTVALSGEELPPPATVVCVDGVCDFVVDGLESSLTAIGIGIPALWLNQFTPDPADLPITITQIRALFGASSTAAGDRYDFYVYTDDDDDPTNGATLIGSHKGYTLPVPQNVWRTITLSTPITINSAEHVLIAGVQLPGNTGEYPAALEMDGYYEGTRSWIGVYLGEDPDLEDADMDPMSATPYPGSWLLRAVGTNSSGDSVDLSPN